MSSNTPRRRSKSLTILFIVVALVLVVILCAWIFQRKIYYYVGAGDPGSVTQYAEDARDIEVHTSDGTTLTAWRLDPADKGRRAVLLLPGNGGNRLTRLEAAQHIRDRGFTVVMVEYRGYGGNPGSPSESGLAEDAQAAADYLASQGFGADDLIVVGESIGTGVAVNLATSLQPAGLLLRSPFTTFDEVASDLVGGVPVGWFLRDHYLSVDKIKDVESPVLILAGSADTLVDPAQSRELSEVAPDLVDYVEVEGAGHNDGLWFSEYLADAVERLDESL